MSQNPLPWVIIIINVQAEYPWYTKVIQLIATKILAYFKQRSSETGHRLLSCSLKVGSYFMLVQFEINSRGKKWSRSSLNSDSTIFWMTIKEKIKLRIWGKFYRQTKSFHYSRGIKCMKGISKFQTLKVLRKG